MDTYLSEIDKAIRAEVERRYEGYKVEWYASGFDMKTGTREQAYDVFLKDGSRFIASATYKDVDGVKVTERDYIEY